MWFALIRKKNTDVCAPCVHVQRAHAVCAFARQSRNKQCSIQYIPSEISLAFLSVTAWNKLRSESRHSRPRLPVVRTCKVRFTPCITASTVSGCLSIFVCARANFCSDVKIRQNFLIGGELPCTLTNAFPCFGFRRSPHCSISTAPQLRYALLLKRFLHSLPVRFVPSISLKNRCVCVVACPQREIEFTHS